VEHREIRYGLLSEIKRTDHNRNGLLAMVESLIATFNQETARRRTAGVKAVRIQESELQAFRSALARVPSVTPVGSLLVGIAACLPVAAAAEETPSAAEQATVA
jgi:hypothetical protein